MGTCWKPLWFWLEPLFLRVVCVLWYFPNPREAGFHCENHHSRSEKCKRRESKKYELSFLVVKILNIILHCMILHFRYTNEKIQAAGALHSGPLRPLSVGQARLFSLSSFCPCSSSFSFLLSPPSSKKHRVRDYFKVHTMCFICNPSGCFRRVVVGLSAKYVCVQKSAKRELC